MAKKQSEVAAELASLTALVKKIQGEITTKLQALADAIANQGNASPEVETALSELTEAVKVADDLNPDAPVEEIPTDETPVE